MIAIGLKGPMGAGKSAIAEECVQQLGVGSTVISFSHPINEMLVTLLKSAGYGEQQAHDAVRNKIWSEQPLEALGGRTVRHAQQTLGTEWGRALISPELWTKTAQQRMLRFQHELGGQVAIFENVRFQNEADMIRRHKGKVFEVVGRGRPLTEDSHASEMSIAQIEVDGTLDNSGGLSHPVEHLCAIIEGMK